MRPPRDLAELTERARALEGLRVDQLARRIDEGSVEVGLHTKGKLGELVERVLGATGGSTATHDFPELGVELKTIPVNAQLRPRESTYVCRISIAEAERAEWETSWVHRKLSHVLWVPIVDWHTVARPVFWRPSPEQERTLRLDFEELMGIIGAGHIEELTARDGEVLQVRPKAQHGRVRTTAWDRDGDPVATVPRGFYLRPRFTATILAP